MTSTTNPSTGRSGRRRAAGAALAATTLFGWVAFAPTGATAAPAAPAAPAGAPPPALIASAQAGSVTIVDHCEGPDTVLPAQGIFKIQRPNNTSGTLLVNVSYGGSLQPGTDYPALPNPVTLPAGETTAFVGVKATAPGDVTLTIEPGDGYTVGNPATATVEISAQGGELGCQPVVAETIDLGAQPAPYPVYDRFGFGIGDSTFQIEGEEPPGLSLRSDGSWSGAATQLGTYEFTACYEIGGFCGLELPFRITVVEADADVPVVPGPAPATPAAPVNTNPSYTG